MATGKGKVRTRKTVEKDEQLKAYLITPVDIRYSYRATERWVYEVAKYLRQKGVDARILITKSNKAQKQIKEAREALSRYSEVPKSKVPCRKITLPLNFNIFTYRNLPKDGIVYFPYSIYDYIINLMMKPKGQKYIIGAHSMHLKSGHIVKGHNLLEGMLNWAIKTLVLSRKDIVENVYYHVLNHEQRAYLLRLGIREDHIFQIPIFIDVKDFAIKSNTSEKLRVIHIGGVQKGAETMVKVIKALMSTNELENFEFYFIGDEEPAELQAYAQENKNIHLLGRITDAEKPGILSSMDVMVLPAVENFPKTMLEGLASGLHIVASEMNPAAFEVRDAGANVMLADNTTAYITHLLTLSDQKGNYAFDAERKTNRDIAKGFDRKIVLKMVYNLFRVVQKKKN